MVFHFTTLYQLGMMCGVERGLRSIDTFECETVTSASFHVMAVHILGGTETNDEGLRAVGLHDRDSNSEPVMYVIRMSNPAPSYTKLRFEQGVWIMLRVLSLLRDADVGPLKYFWLKRKGTGRISVPCFLVLSRLPGGV